MKLKKKHNNEEDTFWLSATDLMAGILTVVLLLLMLFILYLNQSKDEVFTPLDATTYPSYDATNPYEQEPSTNYTEESYPTDSTNHSGGNDTPTAPTETQPIIIQGGPGDEGNKAAVFVTVVDADTGNTIKKSGVAFELYAYKNGIGGLQALYTYYPLKVEYKTFETDSKGTFYLPEKITKGWYSLHNLVPPEGYYVEENIDFEIDEYWDWPEPYMVTVSMKPIKKTIRISAEDSDTGENVEGAEYQVIAAENIVSADESVRYTSGQVVDTIITDESGYAESKELYIGKYHVKQISAPEYYAVDNKVVATSVAEAAEDSTGLVKIVCYKTTVTVRLTDERTEEPIKGAVYTTADGEEYVTDKNGQFKLSDLAKTTSYQLTAVSVPDGYNKHNQLLSFTVDRDGLVNERSSAVINDTAYSISLSVEVKDYIFGKVSKGVDLVLLDEDENVIEEWTTSDKAYTIRGLSEGRYFVQRGDDKSSRVIAYVTDTADLQNAEMRIWDTLDVFALLILVGSVILAGIILVFFINHRKKVKRTHE